MLKDQVFWGGGSIYIENNSASLHIHLMFRNVFIQLASDALFPCQQKGKQGSTIPLGKKGKVSQSCKCCDVH